MSNLKKRQHYVWRKYLRAWTTDDSIWTLLKEQDKVLKIGLMGVAQEKYFYELVDLSDTEEAFLEKFINHISPESVRSLNLDFFNLFTSHYKLRKQLSESKLITIEKDKLEAKIRELEVNLMEDSHCIFESIGNKITNCRIPADLEFLESEDDFFETIMFLCFQYFRTKKMKKSVLKSFENEKNFSVEKFWNIISYSMSTILARNLSLDQNLKFLVYDNQTDQAFLTNDQPIFNILNDDEDENGYVKKLELYYPISPKLAFSIHFRNQTDKIENIIINKNMVNWFNERIIENSNEFIFSENEIQLNQITI